MTLSENGMIGVVLVALAICAVIAWGLDRYKNKGD
jgi:hypothetical protein